MKEGKCVAMWWKMSPGQRQAIIWTNAGILLIRPLGTNFNEMLIESQTFSFMNMRLKVLSSKWLPFCLGLNVLTLQCLAVCIKHLRNWHLIKRSIFKVTNTQRNFDKCFNFIISTLCMLIAYHLDTHAHMHIEGILPKRTLSAMRQHGG